ncbi:MAG: GlcG/HbpS family heme-binding protein [Pseudomonadota bacterium]
MKKKLMSLAAATTIGMMSFGTVQAEDAPMVPIKRLSMEMAQQVAEAAVKACREEGVQVAATVVDRGGHAQAVLRDVLAMDLTLTISKQKAYTALSFNSATSALEGRFEGPHAVPKIDGLVISAGGLPITAGGTILGGVGVSGAPSGETDERCAQAGIDAVIDELEMAAF